MLSYDKGKPPKMDNAGNQKRIPHYSLTTVSNSAADYSNQEQDVIRQAFHTGNYTWMKELLPVEIYPESVNFLRKKRMEHNRLVKTSRQPMTWTRMTSLWGGGYYFEFEFMPDPYDAKNVLDKQFVKEQKDRVKQVGHPQNWQLPSQVARLKHEPMVITKDEIMDPRKKETLPYLGVERSVDKEASSSKEPSVLIQQPSFRAGRGAGLNDDGKFSRVGVQPQIVHKLQDKLNEDWDDVTVLISVTEQDMVQIAFEMKSVDSERGVMAYMNILSKDCELVNALGLRKVSQLWGVQRTFPSALLNDSTPDKVEDSSMQDDSTWMFFLMCPKWVKMRGTDAYYTRHPRSHGSQFRMSQAGSSVLLSMGNSIEEQSRAENSISSTDKRYKQGANGNGKSDENCSALLPSPLAPGPDKMSLMDRKSEYMF